VVNHRDGNKQHNALGNLEYVTHRQNAIHALMVIGRRKGPTKPPREKKGRPSGLDHWTKRQPAKVPWGERMHSKVTADDVEAMRYLVGLGRSQSMVAQMFGLSVAQTSRIVNRTRWKRLPQPAPVSAVFPEWLRSAA
jgi:predicted DNA-binding protein (UPF0251 family)